MPKEPISVNSKTPFSADILIRHETHVVNQEKSNGYIEKIPVEGGILLSIKVSADTLEGLRKKIEGHIALVE